MGYVLTSHEARPPPCPPQDSLLQLCPILRKIKKLAMGLCQNAFTRPRGDMFSRAVKLLTLQGFDIKVDPSWLLSAALITWSLSAHYFPESTPSQSQPTYILMGFITALDFLFVCCSTNCRTLWWPAVTA